MPSLSSFHAGVAAFAVVVLQPAAPAGGTARGTLTVNGHAVTLRHAYAALEPNSFDSSKNDVVVVLTDKPIPAAVLAAKTLGGPGGAAAEAGIENYLRVEFWEADEQERQSSRAILGAWIVGHRTISHQALKGKSLQVSPDPAARLDGGAIGSARVRGRLHTGGPRTFPHDDEHAFDVTFDAAVAARRPDPPPQPEPGPALDERRAKPLPAGGGDPGAAYLAYNKALRSADIQALARVDSTLEKASEKEKQAIRELLPGLVPMLPGAVKVLGGRSDGTVAVLDLQAVVMGQPTKGTAHMILSSGRWMYLRDIWK